MDDTLIAYYLDLFNQKWQEDENGCWIWTAYITPYGYGQFAMINLGYKPMHASRSSWILHHKKDPGPGLLVCHTCDVRPCVNPDHLFLGTHNDNKRDCVSKNRQAQGARNAQSKLTVAEVREIKKLMAKNVTQYKIAIQYNIHESQISAIKHGRTWRHVK